MRRINYIVLHCTAGPLNQSLEEIKEWWATPVAQGGPGFGQTPGYHIIIKSDGTAVRLSPDEKPTYGVANHNSMSLHVCCIGGAGGKDTRTAAQLATLEKRVRYWLTEHPDAEVLGHRDLSPDRNKDSKITPDEWVKTCPNYDARAWWASVK